MQSEDQIKILITGAFGFVGRNISSMFNLNTGLYSLTAVDLEQVSGTDYNDFYSWKELDRINWDGFQIIIHLAGKAHDTSQTSDPNDYFRINLKLTEKIYSLFLNSSIKKFIFFSSVKAVADSVPGEELTEDDEPRPHTPYGKSKLAAEEYLLSKNLDQDRKLYILRPCMIHGPYNKGNLNLLYRLVQKGIPYPLGAFENARSYTSISNLFFILENLITRHDISSGIYQIADDEPISTNDLIRLIAESMQRTERIWCLNKSFVRIGARLGDLIRLPFNSENLKKLTESYVVSNRRLKSELGVKRLPLSSHDGMCVTLNSFNNGMPHVE